MNWNYETKQGDTWDMLALQTYGSEKLAHVLVLANPPLMRIITLPAGLRVTIPSTPAGKTNSPLPPWARG